MVSLVVPIHRIGTHFLKEFKGYGVWEGQITSFEGDSYNVIYPDDGYIENFDLSSMDKVIAKSNVLAQKQVAVVNRETASPIADKTELSAKTTKDNNGGSKCFQKGQHVWVITGKEKHPAVIISIANHSVDGPPSMARIEWSVMHKFEDVKIDSLMAMFEGNDVDAVASTYRKRSRKRTSGSAPPSKVSKRVKSQKSDNEGAKKEAPPRGEMVKHVSIVDDASSNKKTSKKSKGTYYHEGFKFTRIKVGVREEEDFYRCSYNRSTNCPMRLKLNRESGIARAYTVNTSLFGHVDECKCKNGKVAANRSASSNFAWTPKGKKCKNRNRKSNADSTGQTGYIKLGADKTDSHLKNCKQHHFIEGEYVWVVTGKAKHPAVIDSIGDDAKSYGPKMARVRWTSTNTIGEAEVNQFLPMFENENGKAISSSFSRRERKPTNRFAPPQLREKTQVENTPKSEHHGVKNVKKASIEEKSDIILKNLDTILKIPPGVAPGSGWKSRLAPRGRTNTNVRYWISPREKIEFKFPRVAFEFEAIRRRCNGDEKQALNLYKKQRQEAGKKHHLKHQGRLGKVSLDEIPLVRLKSYLERQGDHVGKTVRASVAAAQENVEEQLPDFKQKNFHPAAKLPPGVAPSSGWKSKEVPGNPKHGRRSVAPGEKNIFDAFEFGAIRQQCIGDERQALEVHEKRGKSAVMMPKLTASVAPGEATTKSALLGKMPLIEVKSHLAVETHTEEEKEGAELQDPTESMTIFEVEKSYHQLWDYYLKPTTREGEELPSGMKLRKKKALCNLLRFKNSVFRQKLHAKILGLERLGRRDEIHRLLKAINDHDESMQSGDGPYQLMEEILGHQNGDDEIEVLDRVAIAALKARSGQISNNVEDADSTASSGLIKRNHACESKSKAFTDLRETSRRAIAGSKTKGAATSGEEFDMAAKTNDAKGADLVITNSPSEMRQKVIDLCEDGDIDHPPMNIDKPGYQQQNWVHEVPVFSLLTNHKVKAEISNSLSSSEDSKEIETGWKVIDLCNDEGWDQVECSQRPNHQYVLEDMVNEETTACTSAASSVTNYIASKKTDDDKKMTRQDNLFSADGSQAIQIGQVNPCDGEDFDQSELRQQNTVQNVFQKWVREETESDRVDRDVHDKKQMLKDDIPANVSSNNTTKREEDKPEQLGYIDLSLEEWV